MFGVARGKSSLGGDLLTDPGEYENLPFHGLQTAPNKVSVEFYTKKFTISIHYRLDFIQVDHLGNIPFRHS